MSAAVHLGLYFQSGVKIGSMQEIWRLAVEGGRIDFRK